MIVGVYVGAAMMAAMLAATLVEIKDEVTLLEHFPLVKKSDGIDDVGGVSVVDRCHEQVYEAAGSQRLLRLMLRCRCCVSGSALPRFGPCPFHAATRFVEAAPAAPAVVEAASAGSSGNCVCLPPCFSDEAWVHRRACHGPLAGDLQ